MTPSIVVRASGIAAIAAGALFALIQFVHPAETLEAMTTDVWLVVHVLTLVFPILGLFGITGAYARQIARAGVLGFVAYVVFALGFVGLACFGFYEAFVAPVLAVEAPTYALDAVGILSGGAGPGLLGVVYQATGMLYLAGGIAFGVSIVIAGVLPRWTGIALAAGTALSLLAGISIELGRGSAVVFGAALVCVGLVLVLDRVSLAERARRAAGASSVDAVPTR